MHVRVQLRYAAEVPAVAAMLADERYARARVEASGAAVEQVDVVGSADSAFTVTTRRSLPGTATPSVPRVRTRYSPAGKLTTGAVSISVAKAR